VIPTCSKQGGCRSELSGPGKCVNPGRTTLDITHHGCLTSLAKDDQFRRYAKWMLLRMAAEMVAGGIVGTDLPQVVSSSLANQISRAGNEPESRMRNHYVDIDT
jgi:hypothetical protein